MLNNVISPGDFGFLPVTSRAGVPEGGRRVAHPWARVVGSDRADLWGSSRSAGTYGAYLSWRGDCHPRVLLMPGGPDGLDRTSTGGRPMGAAAKSASVGGAMDAPVLLKVEGMTAASAG